ncbi:hypothetical protein ACIBBB_32905 [Streptomyces sp. NPDC051217]|uniref:hypothetical protein n=1 Tax=Streptomyces sp. NPDC051217 TaxID=3365644 RepID=UPI00378AB33D
MTCSRQAARSTPAVPAAQASPGRRPVIAPLGAPGAWAGALLAVAGAHEDQEQRELRHRHALDMRGTVVTVAAALTGGYLLGRPRPWRRLGNWAADPVRFT